MADGGKVEEFSRENQRRDLKDHDPRTEMDDLLCPAMLKYLPSNANDYQANAGDQRDSAQDW